MGPHIHIEALSLAYRGDFIFSDLAFSLRANSWTALLGQSGIGKTSLLRLLANLHSSEEISTGRIVCDNGVALHEQVAYMAQTDLLLPWFSVLENAVLGLKLRQTKTLAYEQGLNKASDLLGQVGLAGALHLYPHQLSGGMRQRVALVRTLMENKPVVLMDEPFSALDTLTRYQLHELARNLLCDKTVLFITHDPSEALRLAEDIYIMRGKPARLELFARLHSPAPRDPFQVDVSQLQSQLLKVLLEPGELSV